MYTPFPHIVHCTDIERKFPSVSGRLKLKQELKVNLKSRRKNTQVTYKKDIFFVWNLVYKLGSYFKVALAHYLFSVQWPWEITVFKR